MILAADDMSQQAQVVVAGHLCLDIIPSFDGSTGSDLPLPGQLLQIGPAVLSTGGPVSNTGLALHRLGVPTRLMGEVGDDAFGTVVRELISSYSPELAKGIIVARGKATSYSIVLSLPHCDRSFLHCPGVNDTFEAADLDLDAIAHARLFHFGYPPLMARMYENEGRELATMFHTVKSLDVTTSLDLAMVDPDSAAAQADWPTILRATLPDVDVFLPSIEEVLLLLRRSEFVRMTERGALLDQVTPGLVHELASQLLEWGTKIVAFKLGRRGLYLRTADDLSSFGKAAPASLPSWNGRELWSPVFHITRFGGTTGAGDATIAGFLAALLAGCTPEETLTLACAVGACNVECADAVSGIKSWDETWARIRTGWERVPLGLKDPDWTLDVLHGLWERSAS